MLLRFFADEDLNFSLGAWNIDTAHGGEKRGRLTKGGSQCCPKKEGRKGAYMPLGYGEGVESRIKAVITIYGHAGNRHASWIRRPVSAKSAVFCSILAFSNCSKSIAQSRSRPAAGRREREREKIAERQREVMRDGDSRIKAVITIYGHAGNRREKVEG